MLSSQIPNNFQTFTGIRTFNNGDFAPGLVCIYARVYTTYRTYDNLLVMICLEGITRNDELRAIDLYSIHLNEENDLVVEAVHPNMPNDVTAVWHDEHDFVHFESASTDIWFRAYNGLYWDLEQMRSITFNGLDLQDDQADD